MAIPIVPGDEVRMMGTRQKGKVLSVKGQRYQVQFGNLMSTLDRDKIIKTETEQKLSIKKDTKSDGNKNQEQKN
jgi:LysM repeat protein